MQHINTRKLVKIWFTKNPNEFLPYVNQMRMIRLRERNPEAHILLVTNQEIFDLSELKRLENFCVQYNIDVYDFDLFGNEIKTTLDRDLYLLAQKEITYAVEGKGGNFAAASDIVRLFFIAKGFLYSDFDTKVDLGSLPERYFIRESSAPFVLSAYYDKVNEGNALFPICNDIIAVSTENDSTIMKIISDIGNSILESYKSSMAIVKKMDVYPLYAEFLAPYDSIVDIFYIRNLIEKHYTMDCFIEAQKFQNAEEAVKNIRLRVQTYNGKVSWSERFLTDLSVSDNELLERWFLWEKSGFLKHSVMHMSGPALWREYLFKVIDRHNPFLAESTIAERLSGYSLAYHGLSSYLYSPQGYGGTFVVNQAEVDLYFERVAVEHTNDASWYKTGSPDLQAQEELWVP